MARRQYISIDHYQAPFRGAVLQGLGNPSPLNPRTPRQYYELSQFRSPYRHGYYQDNTLMGLGADAGASSIEALQRAIGARVTGQMDGQTQAAIRSAQAKYSLPVNGLVDAALLAKVGVVNAPSLPATGATWRRDLGTALAQVPPWGYGLLAAAFFAASYLSYKRFKKDHPSSSSA